MVRYSDHLVYLFSISPFQVIRDFVSPFLNIILSSADHISAGYTPNAPSNPVFRVMANVIRWFGTLSRYKRSVPLIGMDSTAVRALACVVQNYCRGCPDTSIWTFANAALHRDHHQSQDILDYKILGVQDFA